MRIIMVGGLAAVLLAGCGSGDNIRETQDPCVFLLDFGSRCIPAGKTAICTQRSAILARNTSPECRQNG